MRTIPVLIAGLFCAATLVATDAAAQGAADRETAPAAAIQSTPARDTDQWPVIGNFEAYNELLQGTASFDDRKDEIRFELGPLGAVELKVA